MKRVALVALLLSAGIAQAECYIKSDIHLTLKNINSQPTDIQKSVTDYRSGKKCALRYRVHMADQWYTVDGTGTGDTEQEACAKAIDVGRGTVLEEVTATRVKAKTDMVCSDLPDIRVHTVRIGDVIWESETDMHTVPTERKYFIYKRSTCRMFSERDEKNHNLEIYQGVMCQLNSTGNSKWKVIDKY